MLSKSVKSEEIVNEFAPKNKELTSNTIEMLAKITGEKPKPTSSNNTLILTREEKYFVKEKSNTVNCCPFTLNKTKVGFYPLKNEIDKKNEDDESNTDSFISRICPIL